MTVAPISQNSELGATGWDVLLKFLPSNITYIILLAGLIIAGIVIFTLIKNPNIADEWNAFFLKMQAKVIPKKRKKFFEKDIKTVIHNSIDKAKKEIGEHYGDIIKHDLKLEWIGEDTAYESIFTDKQAIIYVNNYDDSNKQVVSILSDYIKNSFAGTLKYYLNPDYCNASDCVFMKKVISWTRPPIIDYFNKKFILESFNRNPAGRRAYDTLIEIDKSGLFLPILINELNRYANSIFPIDPDKFTDKCISDFINFIEQIHNRKKLTSFDTLFKNSHIQVRIILAVSDKDAYFNDISKKINTIQYDIENGVKTIYILGAGRKIPFAFKIKDEIYNMYSHKLEYPLEINYYLRDSERKVKAVCFELNMLKNI